MGKLQLTSIKNTFDRPSNNLDSIQYDNKLRENLKSKGYTNYFKLYDDDDIFYYSGYLHLDCEDEFIPLYWAMNDSGCTYIMYRNSKTNKMEIL